MKREKKREKEKKKGRRKKKRREGKKREGRRRDSRRRSRARAAASAGSDARGMRKNSEGAVIEFGCRDRDSMVLERRLSSGVRTANRREGFWGSNRNDLSSATNQDFEFHF